MNREETLIALIPTAKRIADRNSHDYGEADDMEQEALLAAIQQTNLDKAERIMEYAAIQYKRTQKPCQQYDPKKHGEPIAEDPTDTTSIEYAIGNIIKDLPKRQLDIVEQRILEQKTLESIGKQYGLTKQRIQQIETEIRQTLQRRAKKEEYKTLLKNRDSRKYIRRNN